MSLDVDLEIEGLEAASFVFECLEPELKKETAPVLEEMAKNVAARAKANVQTGHPRNLFRKTGSGRRLTPNYRPKKQGEFWWIVQTPGSEVGKKEAMAEFMASGYTPQGAALVRALNSIYGREGGSGGGRILYKTFDDMQDELMNQFNKGLDRACKTMNERLRNG